MHKLVVLLALFGSAFAGDVAAPVSTYGAPAAVAPAYGAPAGNPAQYSHSVNAAAIRNVETVGVTKTITPVVTKTTTHQTHSEPALSVGHVQGYTQSAAGPARVAPVQYNTQYTQYLNPTVGVNGPVTYSGPAVGAAGYAIGGGAGYAAAPALGYAAAPVAYAQAPVYAQAAYAAPAYAQAAYAAPAPIAYAAAPAIGYSNLAGYAAAAPQFHAAPAAIPAAIEGGSYGGAQFLSEAGQGLSAAYGVHKK